jgi:hypothetical protein
MGVRRIMKRVVLICTLAAALFIPSLGWAAGAGNPAATIGKENYGLIAEGEEQIKRIDGDVMSSRRYLAKFIWGTTDRLDLYAKLGASGLRVAGQSDFPDFDTAPRSMTWGGGGKYILATLDEPVMTAYIDLQMLAFSAESSIDIVKTVGGEGWQDSYTEQHDARYKYREIQFSLITTWHHDVFAPYGGFGLTNVFGHVDREVASELSPQISKHGNDFREYAIPELILGMDISLGGTGKLSAEIRLSDDSDISYFIGLSELKR